jgi:6-phosphogluconolactonase
MKFRNLGQVVLASVVSIGLCLGVTSCSTSYTVGFLYVLGVSTNNGQTGQISGYKINNNTGQLTPIKKSPFGSAGINPIRAVVMPNGRFLYVLNSKAAGTSGGNIALFTIGGDGVLTYQASYSSQGNIPISLAAASGGSYLYALDQEVLDANGNVVNDGNGAITAFSVDSNTGRLSLITNQQVLTSSGGQLPYFPVGKQPTAFGPINNSTFVVSSIYTVDSADQSIFPYTLNPNNGQLAVTQNGPQRTGATRISVIGGNARYVFLLDAATNLILPYTYGSNGALQTVVGGSYPNDATVSNPSDLVVDSKNVRLYIANAGPNTNPTNAASAVSAYSIVPNGTTGLLQPIGQEPFTAGSQPTCILEDPSDQYLYTGNFASNTVTGKKIDSNTGTLTDLPRGSSWAANGSPTWCVASRTNQ